MMFLIRACEVLADIIVTYKPDLGDMAVNAEELES